MFGSKTAKSNVPLSLDPLDRVAIAYLTLPLVIFLLGWFQWWVTLPLIACVTYALRSILADLPGNATRMPVTRLQLSLAVAVGCAWTVLGGTGHFVFTNFDWFVRDSVLHDLVAAHWPVSYGPVGKDALLRAPVAYYLPAALIGKLTGVATAHLAMAAWTAAGATLFLLQVLSLTPSRTGVATLVLTVVVLFSGFDVIGNLLNDGARFFATWNIAKNLEWWAGTYQYSSMTTQLFWAPNHALGGWLMIGLILRDGEGTRLDPLLPILVVATALWSPLTVIGVIPFVVWKLVGTMSRQRFMAVLAPRIWLPALPVGLVVAAYLALDTGGIKKGWVADNQAPVEIVMELLRQAEFVLLEAGIIGFAVLAIRRCGRTVLALLILALLPLVNLGPGNDLVMRASIPALTVLAIEASLALSNGIWSGALLRKKMVLCGLLAVGAVTPIQEIARAVLLPAWPINMQLTLMGVNCGEYPAHYLAALTDQNIVYLLRRLRPLEVEPRSSEGCSHSAMKNPATALLYEYGLTQ